MIEDTVLFAKLEAFWLILRSWAAMILRYDAPTPDDNERLDYEMAQPISELFWPPMLTEG